MGLAWARPLHFCRRRSGRGIVSPLLEERSSWGDDSGPASLSWIGACVYDTRACADLRVIAARLQTRCHEAAAAASASYFWTNEILPYLSLDKGDDAQGSVPLQTARRDGRCVSVTVQTAWLLASEQTV